MTKLGLLHAHGAGRHFLLVITFQSSSPPPSFFNSRRKKRVWKTNSGEWASLIEMRKMTGDTGTRLVFITCAQIRHKIDILKVCCCLASEKLKLSQNKFDYDFNPGFNNLMSFDKRAVDLFLLRRWPSKQSSNYCCLLCERVIDSLRDLSAKKAKMWK